MKMREKMIRKVNPTLSVSFRWTFLMVATLACLAAAAQAQSSTCPQVVLSETHSCVVGSCQGTYGVNLCNTNDLTSSYQCVYQTPTCCGKQQVAFQSATEGAACPSGCSSIPRKPQSSPSGTTRKQEPTQADAARSAQTKEAALESPTGELKVQGKGGRL
jgi:hypothetical protein